MAVMALAMAGAASIQAQIIPDSAPVITVCMDASGDNHVTYVARGEASKVLGEIPVRIVWGKGRACRADNAIHIHLVTETPRTLRPDALGFALPYRGTYIEIFYDRVESTVQRSMLPHFLAYVLVHEIGHILEGMATHSSDGIMKARWELGDLDKMKSHSLHFLPADIELMHLAIRNRASLSNRSLISSSFAPSATELESR